MRSAAWYRAVDDACVALMEATSWRNHHNFLVDCGGCGLPFWAPSRTGRPSRRYCSVACCSRASYWRHADARERRLQQQRVYRLNRRAAQEVTR